MKKNEILSDKKIVNLQNDIALISKFSVNSFMTEAVKDFFSKCNQIRRKLRSEFGSKK